ncbi:MAG TPA: DNA mismatch repair protein MutT [Ornithinibacillus sp.]|uniref:7,8-dihydro-8-oxoguanine triphosphatase n=2 Tax=Ornithinibacillus bavariensis TaxID=545502 RepID=A0A919XAL0_9BACI|nr:NUDIX domain-containing protein [Ornithinibacillus bavariensis]GIO27427.1 7,8-dihydro-8-oxoguanine triphosphatase [Ornithinibacillus bavariensis]HAM82024.1 DNA mismatch repair protein MutT [Ornithinibacillus sp.]
MVGMTLCIIKRNNELLLLNRNSKPAKGLWNGTGGKIEGIETPLECVIREVNEETSIDIRNFQIIYKGQVTWTVDNNDAGGFHLYLVEVPSDFSYSTPIKTKEGILDWKSIDWALSEENLGLGEAIPKYLPFVLYEDSPYDFHFTLLKNKLIDFTYLKRDIVKN